jgi:hypothetical protein
MDHSHHTCAHNALKFCSHCNKVWCQTCKAEWGQTVYSNQWYPQTYPNYPLTYYQTSLGGLTGNATITNAEAPTTLTACAHGGS